MMLLRLSTHLTNNASVENVKTKKNNVCVHVNATVKKKKLDKIIHQICHVNRNDNNFFFGAFFFFFKQHYYSLSDFFLALLFPY